MTVIIEHKWSDEEIIGITVWTNSISIEYSINDPGAVSINESDAIVIAEHFNLNKEMQDKLNDLILFARGVLDESKKYLEPEMIARIESLIKD